MTVIREVCPTRCESLSQLLEATRDPRRLVGHFQRGPEIFIDAPYSHLAVESETICIQRGLYGEFIY